MARPRPELIAAGRNAGDELILTMRGGENAAVYDGSLLEWAPDPALSMTT